MDGSWIASLGFDTRNVFFPSVCLTACCLIIVGMDVSGVVLTTGIV